MLKISYILILFASFSAFSDEVPPSDSASKIQSFVQFRNKLVHALEKKDDAFLWKSLDSKVQTSFGEPCCGIEEFKKKFDDTKRSELLNILKLGCVKKSQKEVNCPYILETWPSQYNPMESAVLIRKNIEIKTKPSRSAKGRRIPNFSVVSIVFDQETLPSGWKKVEYGRVGTTLVGYVEAVNLRSPIDYRANFKLISNQWVITSFIAGD